MVSRLSCYSFSSRRRWNSCRIQGILHPLWYRFLGKMPLQELMAKLLKSLTDNSFSHPSHKSHHICHIMMSQQLYRQGIVGRRFQQSMESALRYVPTARLAGTGCVNDCFRRGTFVRLQFQHSIIGQRHSKSSCPRGINTVELINTQSRANYQIQWVSYSHQISRSIIR